MSGNDDQTGLSDSDDLIRPLKIVESQFLQVLLPGFSLRRWGKGLELSVEFNDETDSIYSRAGKAAAKERNLNFDDNTLEFKQKLEALRAGTIEGFEWKKPDFRFRYASGGTLPVLRFEDEDYYCLFYRDIFPIGWNIANGGCDTIEELLDPVEAIKRELCEELVIADDCRGIQYTLAGDTETEPLKPYHVSAQRSFWLEIFPKLARHSFERVVAPMKWLDGPDRLKVSIKDYDSSHISGCFLNINPEDFGIEIDKVAKIAVSGDVGLCDGEHTGNFVLNRLVGLFKVAQLDSGITLDTKRYIPNKFFYNAKGLSGEPSLKICLDKMMERLETAQVRSAKEIASFRECRKDGLEYDLCPVTRQILKLYASRKSTPRQEGKDHEVKVFISYGGDDERIAKEVNDFLVPTCDTFFFMEHNYRDTLSSTIDRALKSAECLILVGTKLSNINRDRCAYEWKRFVQDITGGFKPGSTVIPFLEKEVDLRDLPPEIRDYRCVPFRLASLDLDLQNVARNMPRSCRRAADNESFGNLRPQ